MSYYFAHLSTEASHKKNQTWISANTPSIRVYTSDEMRMILQSTE